MDDSIILKRLDILKKQLRPDSAGMNRAYHKIGLHVTNEARLNIRRQRLIDTGRLLNSITYKIIDTRLEIGSYGVPYAARWELGYQGAETVTAHSRRYQSGTIAQVKAHTRNVDVGARPYLRPAFEHSKTKILEILASEGFK